MLPRVLGSGVWKGVTEARHRRLCRDRNHGGDKEPIIMLLQITVNTD